MTRIASFSLRNREFELERASALFPRQRGRAARAFERARDAFSDAGEEEDEQDGEDSDLLPFTHAVYSYAINGAAADSSPRRGGDDSSSCERGRGEGVCY